MLAYGADLLVAMSAVAQPKCMHILTPYWKQLGNFHGTMCFLAAVEPVYVLLFVRLQTSQHVLEYFVQGAAFLQAHGSSPSQAHGSTTEHTPSSGGGAWADVLRDRSNSSCALVTVLGPSAAPAAEAKSPSPAGCSGGSSRSCCNTRDGSDNTSTGSLAAFDSCSGACAQWVEGGPGSSNGMDSADMSLLGMPTAEAPAAPAAPAGHLPQAAAQQAFEPEQLLEQLGCDIKMVAPSSLEAMQQSSLPTTPGSQGNSALPAVLHSASSKHTR